MKRGFSALVFALCTFTPLSAQTVGKITFVDGDLQIVRDGETIDSSRVDVGFSLENEDQIRVLKGAEAEIALDAKTGAPAVFKMKGVSVLNVSVNSENNKQSVELELVSGSVSLKVQKLFGTNQLSVRTDTAVMGVRGTEFSVDTELDGDALLFTSEGKVECVTEEGKSFVSIPGSAVQSDSDRWSVQSVDASAAPNFRERWRQSRVQRFVANAERYVPIAVNRYRELKRRFDAAWESFQDHKDIVQKWRDESRTRRLGDRIQAARDKRAIAGDLAVLRRLGVALERWNHRIGRWDEVLTAEVDKSVGALKSGNTTVAEFLVEFSKDRAELEKKIARVFFVSKLFAQR